MRVKVCEEKIRHCMELCLVAAIDSKMKEAEGDDWFDTLYAAEEKKRQEDAKRGDGKKTTVLERKHTEIGQCDFQAVMKLLFYRKTYRNTTFRHVIDKESTKIVATIDDLIRFRNKVLAHQEIAVKSEDPGEYSYDNALLDMLYILRCFPEIRGTAHPDEERADEICYYEYALQVYQQYKEEGGFYDYAVADVIGQYQLDVTEKAFQEACDELGIPAFRTKEQIWYFSSRDSKTDVDRVKELFRLKTMEREVNAVKQAANRQTQQAHQAVSRERNKKNWLVLVAVGAVALLLLVIIGMALSQVFKGNDQPGNDLADVLNNDAATDERIQEEIDTFVEDSGNTVQLGVGEGHKPSSAVWLQSGSGSCYSTNEAVVTVSSGGNVTAVGEGEAFVVINAGTGMFKVHKYIVKGQYQTQDQRIQEAMDTFVEDSGNTVQLGVGEGHKPSSAVWLQGGNGSCYSTNEAVVTVSSVGNVTAVGEGEAFVVIKSGGDMFQVYKYTVKGQYQTQDQRIQEAIDSFAPNNLNHTELTVGKTHTPTAAVWLQGGSGSCYSTNEAVVTVSSSGTVTAVGTGEAFVVIKTGGDMYSIQKYTVR